MSDPKSGSFRNHFFYAIQDLARQAKRRFELEAQHFGLTLPQWRLLWQLSRSEGLSQSALATAIESDPMTVGGMVERLEAKGLVVRGPDPTDSRAKIVTVTDEARAMVSELKALMAETVENAFAGVGAEEREITLKVLARVSENMSASSTPEKDSLKEELK